MVWFLVIRIGLSVFADRQAPSRAWGQQVYLVRFDEHRAGLPIQSERATRKIVTLFWRLSCGDVAHDHACVGMLGGL